MRLSLLLAALSAAVGSAASINDVERARPVQNDDAGRNVSMPLFSDLEEMSRIVDISYCTGLIATGISKPFNCWCRCGDFPHFELIKSWHTGLHLHSDSGGYIAVDHQKERIIITFRGTYNIAGWIADFGLSPQEYKPFPGAEDQEDGQVEVGKTTKSKRQVSKCVDCAVHSGFHLAWKNTRFHTLDAVREQVERFPTYELHAVGHSLGAAVAAFAAMDFDARGWKPIVTTFGEPRVGNLGMNRYIDETFGLNQQAEEHQNDDRGSLRWRRVTHTNDPIPLLPPTEWGYAMHGGEIHITQPSLSPDIYHAQHCHGAFDAQCIAGQDATYPEQIGKNLLKQRGIWGAFVEDVPELLRNLMRWQLPHRYRFWQMLVAHRDYFWRLGLCVPGGDPTGGGGNFPELAAWREQRGIPSGKGPIGEVVSEVEKEL
ncbi:hypothetical protein B0A50_06479 [Salinomyces thailandicus]|uniref:Fungal lipase-type domain-containing protein n=1 Tax=Salinomyces thailandicus TaxID=706561 RepID=A0A4U0TPI1_9PEZI|nr:hypothetical protein B0A50_06479 [Salinomyces thailandica]